MSTAAHSYGQGHAESVVRSQQWRTVDNSAAYLRAELRPGLRVLDVGCGPGTITADLARLVAPSQVTGLDVAEDILDQAREHAAGVGTIEFRLGDVNALEFPDGSFDVVHAHQVLLHLRDPVGALREMLRVAKPGGVVAVRDTDYLGAFWFPADPRLDRWRAVYRAVSHANGAEPDARPAPAFVGPRRGRHRRHPERLHLEPLDPRRARLVGRHVGRADPALPHRRTGRRRRPRDSRRPPGDLERLAGLGPASGRVFRDSTRGSPLPQVNPGQKRRL